MNEWEGGGWYDEEKVEDYKSEEGDMERYEEKEEEINEEEK